ncbi:hypothetical protein GCM10010401_12850 [Rarobacter faecitabidus]
MAGSTGAFGRPPAFARALGAGPSWSHVPIEAHLDSATQRGDSAWLTRAGSTVRRHTGQPGSVAPKVGRPGAQADAQAGAAREAGGLTGPRAGGANNATAATPAARQGSGPAAGPQASLAAPADPVARFTSAASGAREASFSGPIASARMTALSPATASRQPGLAPTDPGVPSAAPGGSATPIRRLAWTSGETRPRIPSGWRFAPPPGAGAAPQDKSSAPVVGRAPRSSSATSASPGGSRRAPAVPASASGPAPAGTGAPGSPIIRRWLAPESSSSIGETMRPEGQSEFADALRREVSQRVHAGSFDSANVGDGGSDSSPATQVVDQVLRLVDARLDAVLESRVRGVVDDRILAETERWAWRSDRGVY